MMSNCVIKSATYQGYTLGIHYDDHADSPLEFSNVKIAYCLTSRYRLGNEPKSYEELSEIEEGIDSGKLVGLPVYAYIHSGVALRTCPFDCQWDSGRSGFVYIDPDDRDVKGMSKEEIHRWLEGVVKEYSAFLGGECYYYSVADPDGDVIQSCSMGIWYDTTELLEYLMPEFHTIVDDDLKAESEPFAAMVAQHVAYFATT